MKVYAFKGMFDNEVVEPHDWTWDETVEALTNVRLSDKKDELGFILSRFKTVAEGAKEAKVPGDKSGKTLPGTVGRYASNVIEVQALCIDYDDGATIAEVREQLNGVKHLGYTTFNHRRGERGDRFRVVVPLADPCPAEEWARREKGLLELFPKCDRTTFSLARIFYAPGTDAPEKFVGWSQDGIDFDWRIVPLEEARVILPRPVGVKAGTGRVLTGTLNAYDLALEQGMNPTLIDSSQGKYQVICPRVLGHTKQDPSGTVIWSSVPGRRDGFHCAHSHCKGVRLWDLFPSDVLERHCEREVTGLQLLKAEGKAVEEAKKTGEARQISVPTGRTFNTLSSDAERRRNVARFATAALSTTHSVLRTPEGYGKSTVIVEELLRQGKDVLFCCSSNKQAAEKVLSFAHHGAARAYSRGALLLERLGVSPVMVSDDEPWSVPALDVEGTVKAIVEELKCSEVEAAEALDEICAQAEASRQSGASVLVTTFMTGSVMFNNRCGRLGRVIVVDDPSLSDIERFKFKDLEQVAEREIDKVIFGTEYAFQDPVLWTTTEKLVVEALRRQHERLAVTDVQEALDVEDRILMVPSDMTRKTMKKVLPGIHGAVMDDTKTEQVLMANGLSQEHNLVSTKGRNDLVKDSVIIISFPHPDELAAICATLEVDEGEKQTVMRQYVTDQCDQALGRCQGYRSSTCDSLIVCEPNLEVSIRMRSRYKITTVEGLQRRGRLHGVPLVMHVHTPTWWMSWVSYLATWQKYVVEINGHVYDTLSMQRVGLAPDEGNLLAKRLQKPTAFGDFIWKRHKEHISEEGGRRNFHEVLPELIREYEQQGSVVAFNKGHNKSSNKAKPRKPNTGRKKYVSITGEAKMYVPGTQPADWSLKTTNR